MATENKNIGVDELAAPHEHNDQAQTPDLPNGWIYRHRRIFGLNIPWYASPRVQLVMVAFVCFMCPGMFNALGGMGGGGKTDATLADNMVSNDPKIFFSFFNCGIIVAKLGTS
jgi:hypothetical protein